jgi:hypothetical protein
MRSMVFAPAGDEVLARPPRSDVTAQPGARMCRARRPPLCWSPELDPGNLLHPAEGASGMDQCQGTAGLIWIADHRPSALRPPIAKRPSRAAIRKIQAPKQSGARVPAWLLL